MGCKRNVSVRSWRKRGRRKANFGAELDDLSQPAPAEENIAAELTVEEVAEVWHRLIPRAPTTVEVPRKILTRLLQLSIDQLVLDESPHLLRHVVEPHAPSHLEPPATPSRRDHVEGEERWADAHPSVSGVDEVRCTDEETVEDSGVAVAHHRECEAEEGGAGGGSR